MMRLRSPCRKRSVNGGRGIAADQPRPSGPVAMLVHGGLDHIVLSGRSEYRPGVSAISLTDTRGHQRLRRGSHARWEKIPDGQGGRRVHAREFSDPNMAQAEIDRRHRCSRRAFHRAWRAWTYSV